ncbi:signal peptide peptidase SppA [Rodentibacter trehalosifermentans]|uniref:signal peptide peptidase SppA n=1 Tax=Rodentibacter trehalosifermentans TaxID=1908263 RepID=UPI0009D488E3|nr:signal peptide peptidase SppA [Rodentibacter trehalosifermentans]OOF52882.1 signal peptide peptidase SppA [Rodentibacter trehalosifermentans]
MFRVIRFCWRTLNFIRDLVMNFFFLIFILLLVTLFSFTGNTKKNTVNLTADKGALLLNLDGYLADNRDDTFGWQQALRELNTSERTPLQISTFDVVYAINLAKEDDSIRGLVLDLNYFSGGDLPAMDYIGKAIADFKTSEKPVIAFANNYSQGQYFLASFADQIYLNPIGQVSVQGLAQENLYYKDLLDKLAITPHIFRVGSYKSAVEPFLRNDMSPEAKANMNQWLNGMWESYVQIVSANRHISHETLLPNARQYLADLKALKGNSTAYAKQRKLITDIATHLDLDKKLTALFGKNAEGEVNMVDFSTYLSGFEDRMTSSIGENKIAIVNVEGAIIDGESAEGDVGGDSVARLLRKAYDDNSVKAVILRVNSPGGSAFASELIRQEVDNLQKAGKPVVVSMGAMAASGGYWISATSDYIIADKNTITGSIGIFAMLPTFENAIKKIGINADGVATTELAETSVFSPLSKNTQDIYQLEIEHGYDKFLTLVSNGRQMSKNTVDKIAQGQVWLGKDAFKHNLVDELGDFDRAVEKAGELVNLHRDPVIEDFSVEWITEEDTSLVGKLFKDFRQSGQQFIAQWFDLPKPLQQIKRDLNQLNKFNDPKGHYLYCLNCGKVN